MMHCGRRFSLATALFGILALYALSMSSLSQAADSPWIYGIHWYGDPASNEVEVMTGGKGIWVLETIMTEDAGDWGLAAQLNKLQTAAARGHTIIVRIQPRWSLVVPGPNDAVNVGDRMSTFIPKVINAAQQLGNVCHIWQIGNEMNLGFEYDIGNLTPSLYVQKYVEIRNAIKSVPSSLGPQIVLVGPVAPVDNAYLGAMCDSINAGGHEVDGFAIHAYRSNLINEVKVQADLIDVKGFRQKPIHLTEWGAPVDPISDSNEASVAQYLHSSFSALANYNANPANHDIVSACWFVYKSDYQWRKWSIRYLKDLHPGGANNDLYDAFKYACTLNLPAGEDFSGGSTTQPFISRSPATLSPGTLVGQNAAGQSFTVSNTGAGTLNYSITKNVSWLNVSPSSGSSTGQVNTVNVTYSTSALSAGQYTGTITVSDAQAANNPQTIAVNLTVQAQVVTPTITNPDFEANGGFFAVATGWTGYGGNKWERVLDATRGSTQGVTDIPANGGVCGVYQLIGVTAGAQYRVSVFAKTHTTDLDVSIGVDPGGGTSVGAASFGAVSTSANWTKVTADFTATGSNATIFLRGRNPKSWFIPGNWCLFDGVAIEVLGGSTNSPPTAVMAATPTSGIAPLLVNFSGAGSSDPDNDPLTYSWNFGNGQQGSGVSVSHTYSTAGAYTASLTVNDGRGGTDTKNLTIQVNISGGGGGSNLVANPSFESGFSGGLANSWQSWTSSGNGYFKQSSRLGRIGAGMYSGTAGFNATVRLNPKIVLLSDSALGHSAAIRSALPDALIIGRLYIDPLTNTYLSNPEHYGRVHADNCYNHALQKPGIDAWQGMNEPYLNDVNNARLVGRFERAFALRCRELGLKSCVMNIAVGNPGDMNNMLLPEIVGALEAGDYVGYHSYGGIQNQLMMDPPGGPVEQPWFSLRWRTYIDMYKQHGYRMPPVVYTECTTFYAWHGIFTPTQIRNDLNAFEAETKRDPWSAGMAIFLVGSHTSQWDGWEVANQPTIYEGCGDYNLAHPADAWDGLYSQQFGQTGSAGGFTGGIRQQVAVSPDKTYRLGSWLKYETYGVGCSLDLRVGYDLTGQTSDPSAASIAWSNNLVASETPETDWWYQKTLEFASTGSQVSIWFRAGQAAGKPNFRVMFDDVSLVEIDAPPPPPPPPVVASDFDGDGDVDQADFGFIQKCLAADGAPIIDPLCKSADLDDDNDVDIFDLAIFYGCFNGPDVQPACGQ